jgi:UDP-3-O-[3-hydroxymyristoyl] N-acetylglucosamine deacetylase/3-hydroxyacyl-[acyl-carrier-protein] dehydratase
MEKNLIKGGSLENAIVVRGDAVLSKEPLRFPDEFVRHKIVDIIGDLALFGQRIRGHVIAVKPGHGANAELVRALAREVARTTPSSGRTLSRQATAASISTRLMELLPHRYPFLMVDRVLKFEGETKCIGVKSVTINEPFFCRPLPRPPGLCRAFCKWKQWLRLPAS